MDKKEVNLDMRECLSSNQTPPAKEGYVKIGLFIIRKLNEGTEYNEVKHLVVNEGFPSSYVDGIIALDHNIMSCKTKGDSDEKILRDIVSKGWPKEIAEELIKDIGRQIRHKKS